MERSSIRGTRGKKTKKHTVPKGSPWEIGPNCKKENHSEENLHEFGFNMLIFQDVVGKDELPFIRDERMNYHSSFHIIFFMHYDFKMKMKK